MPTNRARAAILHPIAGALALAGALIASAQAGEFVAPAGYAQHGAAQAVGALVWSHGNAGQADARKAATPIYVRRFADAGWDIYRFDRDPRYDRLDWAIRHLIEGVQELRAAGYRRVIAAGQSRGAWHSLEALRESALLDGVIAAAPAHHGTWSQGGSVGLQGLDDFRALMRRIAGTPVPVALFLFDNDPFDPDPAARAAYAREKLGGGGAPLLVIERPAGIAGHGGASGAAFDARFGACVLDFFAAPARGPAGCPDAP